MFIQNRHSRRTGADISRDSDKHARRRNNIRHRGVGVGMSTAMGSPATCWAITATALAPVRGKVDRSVQIRISAGGPEWELCQCPASQQTEFDLGDG